MAEYYDRYEKFRNNGVAQPVPGILLNPSDNDKQTVYKVGRSRMDKLSQEYYGNPYHGWLIMLANQQYGGMEFSIPDGATIRIPFPFTNAIERYIFEVKKHKDLYG